MKTGRRTERSSHSNLKMSADIPPGTEYTQCLVSLLLPSGFISWFYYISDSKKPERRGSFEFYTHSVRYFSFVRVYDSLVILTELHQPKI